MGVSHERAKDRDICAILGDIAKAKRLKAILAAPEAKGQEAKAEFLAHFEWMTTAQAVSHLRPDKEVSWADLEPRMSLADRVRQMHGMSQAAPEPDAGASSGADAMKRTMEKMGLKRAVTQSGLTAAPAATADANPEDVEPRMSLADRARLMHGRR